MRYRLCPRADPSSIPYGAPEDGLSLPNPEVVASGAWVLNLPGYGSALGSTLRELRVGEEDIFSQSSSR